MGRFNVKISLVAVVVASGCAVDDPEVTSGQQSSIELPACIEICRSSPPATDCLDSGEAQTCGAIACGTRCDFSSNDGDYCFDTALSADSTCGHHGESRSTSNCLLDPTHAGCVAPNSVNGTRLATCNDGTVGPVVTIGKKRYSKLPAADRQRVATLMDNAAAAMGCTYQTSSNPVLDTQANDDDCEEHDGEGDDNDDGGHGHHANGECDHENENGGHSVTRANGGYLRWYGSVQDPGRGCGVVYFTKSLGCAFPMATHTGTGTQGIAATPALLTKYSSLSADTGTLGLPTSLPYAFEDGTSWQRFQWGYVTHKASDGAAYMIGGRVPGTSRLANAAAVAYGREFDTAGSIANVDALMSDPLCINPAHPGSCGSGVRGYRSRTHADVSGGTFFVAESNSDLATRVSGFIAQKYYSVSLPETSCAGFPVGTEACGDSLCSYTFQAFSKATIFSRRTPNSDGVPLNQTFILDGGVRTAYQRTGGPAGALGFPIEDAPSCGIPGTRIVQFENGSLTSRPDSFVDAAPPLAASELQLGSYQMDSTTYVATAVSTPSPGRIRFTLPAGVQFTSTFRRFHVGSLLESKACPHWQNNQTSAGFYAEGGTFIPVRAASDANSLSTPWVEVDDPGRRWTATGETCRVTLSNPIFKTTRLNSQSVGIRFLNNTPGGTINVWRQVTDLDGQVGPWTVATTRTVGAVGLTEIFDPFAAPNRKNCYKVETVGGGETNTLCAFTPTNEGRVSRVQLRLELHQAQVIPSEGVIPMRVRLQSPSADVAVPNGNVSWLDTTAVDFRVRAFDDNTYVYDLSTSNIRQLSDITAITVEPLVTNAMFDNYLCLKKITLIVDFDRADRAEGPYRTAFERAWPSSPESQCVRYLENYISANRASPWTVPFNLLRNSSDWQYQVDHWYDIQNHFLGYARGNEFKSYLMGAFSNALHSADASFVDGSALTISKTTLQDQRAHITTQIHHVVDITIDADLVIKATFACVYDAVHSPPGTYNEIVDTQVVLENIEASASSPGVSLGGALLQFITLNLFDLSSMIQSQASDAMSNIRISIGTPSSAFHFAFTPPEGSNDVGFSYALGQSPPPTQPHPCPNP